MKKLQININRINRNHQTSISSITNNQIFLNTPTKSTGMPSTSSTASSCKNMQFLHKESREGKSLPKSASNNDSEYKKIATSSKFNLDIVTVTKAEKSKTTKNTITNQRSLNTKYPSVTQGVFSSSNKKDQSTNLRISFASNNPRTYSNVDSIDKKNLRKKMLSTHKVSSLTENQIQLLKQNTGGSPINMQKIFNKPKTEYFISKTAVKGNSKVKKIDHEKLESIKRNSTIKSGKIKAKDSSNKIDKNSKADNLSNQISRTINSFLKSKNAVTRVFSKGKMANTVKNRATMNAVSTQSIKLINLPSMDLNKETMPNFASTFKPEMLKFQLKHNSNTENKGNTSLNSSKDRASPQVFDRIEEDSQTEEIKLNLSTQSPTKFQHKDDKYILNNNYNLQKQTFIGNNNLLRYNKKYDEDYSYDKELFVNDKSDKSQPEVIIGRISEHTSFEKRDISKNCSTKDSKYKEYKDDFLDDLEKESIFAYKQKDNNFISIESERTGFCQSRITGNDRSFFMTSVLDDFYLNIIPTKDDIDLSTSFKSEKCSEISRLNRENIIN